MILNYPFSFLLHIQTKVEYEITYILFISIHEVTNECIKK